MSQTPSSPLDRLRAIMAHLRHPQTGCEWDRAQTFATIAPYTIEEAYEVADAIEQSDMAALKAELGDLLLQVVFHAQIGQESAHFDFDDIATAIADKLEARHPHIFGTKDPDEEAQSERWERIKASERDASGATSALDGVARTLPALMRAEKLQKRAARHGFDWPDIGGPVAKLHEELAELADAQTPEDRMTEAGDLLFAAVNVVRSHGVAPEDALRAGNAKFENRFRLMERLASEDGNAIGDLPLEHQEEYWQAAKQSER